MSGLGSRYDLSSVDWILRVFWLDVSSSTIDEGVNDLLQFSESF